MRGVFALSDRYNYRLRIPDNHMIRCKISQDHARKPFLLKPLIAT
ncbi:MAG TPA: hypothetical protein O0X23_02435 [Methanocorpusculum sp.]|nr:hypothetical protein [Methanocorpusculum sp.]